jgi:hypothetical protein
VIPVLQNGVKWYVRCLCNRIAKAYYLLLRQSVTRLALAFTLLATASPAAADTLIDSFENRASIAPWSFYNGAEFPGATGSLALGAGHTGQGAHLAYNLSAGGAYVEADLTLPNPLDAEEISLWLRSPANIYVTLRAVDSSGQTLQYKLNRPITAASDITAWYQQFVPLDSPTLWYGGANDGVVHGSIMALGVLAGNPQLSGPVDSIDFDDVTAVTSKAITLRPTVNLLPAPAGNGDLLAQMGVNVHFTSDDQALNAAEAMGFSWARMDLFWEFVEETAGVYDFSQYDALVASLASRGMHALLILDYGNPLYTSGSGPPTTTAAITAYTNFAKAAAAHFAGTGTRFEIWNEPDVEAFWAPAPNSTQYAALSNAAIAAMHKGDPNALVSTAGLAGFDFNFASGYLSNAGGVGANAIGIHPYDITNPVGNLVDNLVLLRGIAAQNLGSPPAIWDTEWGFTSVSFSPAGTANGHDPGAQKQQAQFAVEEMLASCGVGFPLYIYYDIRDDGTDATNQEDNFGLLANDYTVKPAYTAIATMANKVRGRTFVGFLPMVPTTVVAMEFDGPTSQVIAMWSDTPSSSVSVTIPGNSFVSDFLGNAIAVQNNTLTLTGGEGPIYVTTVTQARLSNFSVRSLSTPGANQLIAGFAIAGGSKSILVRGDGPTLASFGVTGVLTSVTLTLYDSSSAPLATNTGWGGTVLLTAAFSQVGAFSLPANSLDSALLATLAPGAYTASVIGSDGSSGVGLTEVYDADTGTSASRLTNGSARTYVGTGAQTLIAGFSVTSPGTEQLLIRAIGPGLSKFGLTGVLAHPVLTIFDSKQHPIYTNTVWGGSLALSSAFSTVGAFALDANSLDSALIVTLTPGAYTAQVTGVNSGTGVALVEVYEMPATQ